MHELPRAFQSLADRPVWCNWQVEEHKGKPRKVPYHPDMQSRFSTKNDDAYSWLEARAGQPLGLVLTDRIELDGYTLVAFDCDACRDPENGALTQWARDVITEHKNTYSEVTPSGQGIRVFVWVRDPPEHELPKARSLEPATGATKAPEIETFGLGRACYVTLTGVQVPHTSAEIQRVQDLSWLRRTFALDITPGEKLADIPHGTGEPPDVATIGAKVRQLPEGEALAAGRWEDFCPDSSASEGYMHLTRLALNAANGHGNQALDWLLHDTAYGRADVDSADPFKYAKPSWVASELKRIGGKTDDGPNGVAVFGEPEEQDPEPARVPPVLQLADYVAHVGSASWLVYKLLPARGLMTLTGDPGSGKSAVAYDLAVKCALHVPTFCGAEFDAHGPVVIFVGEDAAGVSSRLQAELRVVDPIAALEDVPVYLTTLAAKLTDGQEPGQWVKEVLALTGGAPPRLVIVDTLARNYGPGSESDTEDMGHFVRGCQELERGFGGALVIAVHHSGREHKDRNRGASALDGACDAIYIVQKSGDSVQLRCTKMKQGAEPAPLHGKLAPVVIGKDQKGRPVDAVTFDDAQPDPAAVFAEVATDDELAAVLVYVAEQCGGPLSVAKAAADLSLGRKALSTRLSTLVDLGMVEKSSNGGKTSKATYVVTGQGSTTISQLVPERGTSN